MTVVVDASVVVASMVEPGATGAWAVNLLGQGDLAAPHLLPFEVVSALRRLAARGEISGDVASLARLDLATLPIELFPYSACADRVWELRDNLTSYDASYVALAESLGAELATIDRKLTAAAGARCRFRTP